MIPVSLKLKKNIGTYKSNCIIHKAGRKLLNKRIRNINNTIEDLEHAKYMYECELKGIASIGIYKECEKYIEYAKETRHNKALQRQVSKFERLSEKNSAKKSGHSKQCHRGMYLHSGRYMYQQEPDQNTINQQKKWVINLSDVPLTPAQEAVLAHGPNFAVTPKNPPILEYITSLEVACQKLNTSAAEELRSEVYRALRYSHHHKPNLKKEEMKALKQLRLEKNQMVLTADKGVAVVVMNRHDYIKKARALLVDTNTYKPITSDPTTKLKNKLINIPKMIKGEGNIDENTYKRVYPTGASTPKFYRLPKIHKEDVPLRPTVSSIRSVTYAVAKELSQILKPLVGNSIHHVNNSKEFTEEIRNIKVERGECITSFDVTALYTSIPVADAIEVIKRRLEQDTELPRRTTWSPNNILKLLEFCLVNTYFLFDGQFFEQTKGGAMGSPVSPIVANIYMEAFEDRAINTVLHPLRYGKDMWMIPL